MRAVQLVEGNERQCVVVNESRFVPGLGLDPCQSLGLVIGLGRGLVLGPGLVLILGLGPGQGQESRNAW